MCFISYFFGKYCTVNLLNLKLSEQSLILMEWFRFCLQDGCSQRTGTRTCPGMSITWSRLVSSSGSVRKMDALRGQAQKHVQVLYVHLYFFFFWRLKWLIALFTFLLFTLILFNAIMHFLPFFDLCFWKIAFLTYHLNDCLFNFICLFSLLTFWPLFVFLFYRRKLWLVSVVHVGGGGIIWRYSLLFAPIQVSSTGY